MTSSTRVIAICACVVLLLSLVVGAALIGHFANEAKEQKAAAQGYTSAIGTVVSIDENTYSCFKQGGCSSCSGGGSYPPCRTLIRSNQSGFCTGSEPICCRTEWYRRVCDSANRCHRQPCFSVHDLCPYSQCADMNHAPLCKVHEDTCSRPSVVVVYNTTEDVVTFGTASTHCGFGDDDCLQDFTRGLVVNSTIEVFYRPQNPESVVLGEEPSFSPSGKMIAGFVFGALALLCALVSLVVGIVSCVLSCSSDTVNPTTTTTTTTATTPSQATLVVFERNHNGSVSV